MTSVTNSQSTFLKPSMCCQSMPKSFNTERNLLMTQKPLRDLVPPLEGAHTHTLSCCNNSLRSHEQTIPRSRFLWQTITNAEKYGKTVGFNPSIVTQLAPPRCSSVRWCRSSAFEELSGQQSKAWDGMGTKLDIEFLGTFLWSYVEFKIFKCGT